MKKQRPIWVQLICSDLQLAGHEVMAGRPAIHGWSQVIGFHGVGWKESRVASSQEHMSLKLCNKMLCLIHAFLNTTAKQHSYVR